MRNLGQIHGRLGRVIVRGTCLAATVGVLSTASYFFDGFGIAGQVGDVIQLQGQTTTARVTAVDPASNTLTVDQPLSWKAAAGISLQYSGAAPDIGAYEYGL